MHVQEAKENLSVFVSWGRALKAAADCTTANSFEFNQNTLLIKVTVLLYYVNVFF